MILLRHVHLFIKFGVTIEHNDTATTALFDVLDFIIALTTFDRWAGRYIRLRYGLSRCYRALITYRRCWAADFDLMTLAARRVWRDWAGCPNWSIGAG
jgi:hypothetical protein